MLVGAAVIAEGFAVQREGNLSTSNYTERYAMPVLRIRATEGQRRRRPARDHSS